MKNFCGCCGREVHMPVEGLWCRECARHVTPMPVFKGPVACGLRPPAWERTYFARTGRDCPLAA